MCVFFFLLQKTINCLVAVFTVGDSEWEIVKMKQSVALRIMKAMY